MRNLTLILGALLVVALAGCASDPASTAGATPNTYCGNWTWGTIDKNGVVKCPN